MDGESRVPVIRATEIHKHFGPNHILKGVSLEVHAGEVVCILGPSGSGKTTFLRCINHLEAIDAGRIEVSGELIGYRQHGETLKEDSQVNIARRRSRIGMVFQRFNLFPHMTALENITEAPVHVLKVPKEEAVARAHALLERVGLADKAGSYPRRLSGGQQQRVAIARALAMDPVLLLFDEPTSALDPEVTGEVLWVMQELAREGMTMVVVTHEIGFAREAATRILMMEDGRVIEDASPDKFFTSPSEQRTRDFLAKVL